MCEFMVRVRVMAYLHVSFYGVRAAKVDLAVSVPQDHRLHEHTYAHAYIHTGMGEGQGYG